MCSSEERGNGWGGHCERGVFRSVLRKWPAISEKETVTNHLSYGRFLSHRFTYTLYKKPVSALEMEHTISCMREN
jgi:hypothetical protein